MLGEGGNLLWKMIQVHLGPLVNGADVYKEKKIAKQEQLGVSVSPVGVPWAAGSVAEM